MLLTEWKNVGDEEHVMSFFLLFVSCSYQHLITPQTLASTHISTPCSTWTQTYALHWLTHIHTCTLTHTPQAHIHTPHECAHAHTHIHTT